MDNYKQNIKLILTAIPELKSPTSWLELTSANPRIIKYALQDATGKSYVLHLADRKDYQLVKQTYTLCKMLHDNMVPLAKPLSFGLCQQNLAAYFLTSRLDGRTARTFLPDQHEITQYLLGQESAILVNGLHGCATQSETGAWFRQMRGKIAGISDLSKLTSSPDILKLLHFVQSNLYIVRERPQSILHGNLVPDNLVCAPGAVVSLTGLENWQYGDPLADLAPVLVEMRRTSRHFVTGFLDCYFSYNIDIKSFHCLAFYAALYILEQFQAAPLAEQAEIRREIKDLCQSYNGFRTVVPRWYKPLPKISLARSEYTLEQLF